MKSRASIPALAPRSCGGDLFGLWSRKTGEPAASPMAWPTSLDSCFTGVRSFSDQLAQVELSGLASGKMPTLSQ